MFPEKKTVTLKTVAERVGLAPCSVSAILNKTEAARAIPQHTKDRVYRAASELDYRPNHWARSLRTRQTRMVAVLAPGLARPAVGHVIAAAQQSLHRRGYLLVLIASDSEDGNRLCAHLQQRGIQGVISIDSMTPRQLGLPVISVDVGSVVSADSVTPNLRRWLSELGESAAEMIIQAVESSSAERRTTVPTKPYPAFFEVAPANLQFTSRAEGA
jgi:DNA-binding LacI/PurR family transcriptional regulator